MNLENGQNSRKIQCEFSFGKKYSLTKGSGSTLMLSESDIFIFLKRKKFE